MRLVLVEWIDSNVASGWASKTVILDDLEAEDLRCETAGWLVAETDRYVAIAASRTIERGEHDEVADVMQIPKAAVTAVRDLWAAPPRVDDPGDGFA